MNNEFVKALDAVCDKFGIAVDWSSKNIIPYVQELSARVVHFKMASAIFFAVVGILMVVSIILWVKLIKYCDKRYKEEKWSDWDTAKGLSIGACIICVVIGMYVVLYSVYDIVTYSVFPEKALVDFISTYMN